MADYEETYESSHSGDTMDAAISWANTHKNTNPTQTATNLTAETARAIAAEAVSATLTRTKTAETITFKNAAGTTLFTISMPAATEASAGLLDGNDKTVIDDADKLLNGFMQYENESGGIKIYIENSEEDEIISTIIPFATETAPGFMTAADKKKLDGLSAIATESTNGLMSASDKTKLDFYEGLFQDDYTIRTTGITMTLTKGEYMPIGIFHIRKGEKFVVTSDVEHSDIEIEDENGAFDCEMDVPAVETEFPELEVSIYGEFEVVELEELSSTVTIKIV